MRVGKAFRFRCALVYELTSPMHCPTHGQWWSKRSTQLLQIEQCEHRGGRYSMQVSQYFVFTVIPLTTTSLTRGSRRGGVWFAPTSVLPSKPSGSGGCALRGMIPGSLPEVRSRRLRSWKVTSMLKQVRGFTYIKLSFPSMIVKNQKIYTNQINMMLGPAKYTECYCAREHQCKMVQQQQGE